MPPPKTCFVTIGATASFSSLIRAVVSAEFFEALEAHAYTDLLVQYGQGGEDLYHSCLEPAKNTESGSVLEVRGFPLDRAGLAKYMLQAKGGNGLPEGVVISHGGTGTIMDALRISVPLIVVPNEELLDNHQLELAAELSKQDYVVHGRLNDMAQALGDAEALSKKRKAWPPPNSGYHRPVKTLKGVIEDELGLLD